MVLLIVYVAVFTRVNSFTVVLAGVTLIEFIHLSLSTYLKRFFGMEEYVELIYHLWYLTFAITDFLFVFLVVYVCKKLGSPLQTTSKLILSIFLFLGCLQVANYAEGLFFRTGFLNDFYKGAIPVVNGIITALLFLQLIFELSNQRRKRELDDF